MKLRNSGFTLTEILVGIAIVGIVLTILAKILVDTSQHDIILSLKQEKRDFHEEIKTLVHSPGCGLDFLIGRDDDGHLYPTGGDNSHAIEPNPNFSATAGLTKYAITSLISPSLSLTTSKMVNRIKVESIQLLPWVDPTNPSSADGVEIGSYFPVDSLNNSIKAQINVELTDIAGATKDKNIRRFISRNPVILKLGPVVSGTKRKIIDCLTIDQVAMTQQICEAMSGSWNPGSFKCDLEETNSRKGGFQNRCAANEACSVASQYRM